MSDIRDARPLTLYFVGLPEPHSEPVCYSVSDRRLSTVTSFPSDMTVIERAALKALCEEALSMLEVAP